MLPPPMHLRFAGLADPHVQLVPYQRSLHGAALRAMSEAHPELFTHWSHRGPGDWIAGWLDTIDQRTDKGTTRAFAVFAPGSGVFLGVTAYLDPNPEHRHVEVGMTVYHPAAHGTAINPAAKRLLLGHAFDCGALRVQFQIDERNKRSQAAVLKLGASREGVLRQHKVLPDGYVRNTVFFSILKDEWPAVKAGLDARLAG